jgi:4-hydroxybenzoate polyprenyltransferase
MAATTKPVKRSAPRSHPGGSRAFAYLQLARPANLLTAAADVLAGSAAAGAWTYAVALLVPASMCLYAGGVIFNDVFDRSLDAIERPERPIPSGRVSVRAASFLGATFLAAGILLSFVTSVISGAIGLAIAGTALTYNGFSKHYPLIGPVNMGLCRGLNLLLGLSAAALLRPELYLLTFIPVLYIGAITALSAGEVHGGTRGSVLTALISVVTIIIAVPLLAAFSSGIAALWAVPFLALLAARVLPAMYKAYESQDPKHIFTAVKAGVLSLIPLDSAIAAAWMGPIHGVIILSLMPLAGLLARVFAVT